MKVVQNIWVLLVCPNVLCINVFSIIFSSIEIYLYYLIMSALFKSALSYQKQVIFTIILVFVGALTSLYIPSPYYVFANLMVAFILSMIFFKKPFLDTIFANVCFYFATFFFSIIWLIIYTNIFGCSANELQQTLLYKIILSTSVNIFYYISYKIIINHPLSLNFLNEVRNHSLLIFNLLFGLVTIIIQFFIAYLYFDYIPMPLNIFNLIILLSYFLIGMYSLYRTNKLETTTQLLEAEMLYNKNLSTLHDNIRGFKHDFNNIVQAIGGYISANNMDALKAYYKDLLADCQSNNNLAVLNPELINNPAIYSLLTDKYYKAIKSDIKIEFEILTEDLSFLNIKTYELARILGILIDNAIEASSKSKNKIVHITFRRDRRINKNLIIIENSYENKNVNIDKIFEKGYTSKNSEDKYNHGLGLWEVKKYLNKRENLNLHTTKNDDFFIQQFEIYDT